jgi:pyruvate formate lyase activating enzyme
MFMREASFYSKVKNAVKCELCARGCVIPEGQVGFCRVRKNVKGKLQSLVYGRIVSVGTDPIEKKPLYMFAPGSKALSMSTVGCNFRCKFCCNYHISQSPDIVGEEYTPKQLIGIAKENNAQGFSYTYVEPSIFYEFAYDTAKIASREDFYNMWVTNGYTSPEAIKRISRYLDAVVVDFKGSANAKFYREYSGVPKVEPIFDALMEYKRNKVYTEVTDLLVPKVGDSMEDLRKLCKWIVGNLGDMTPFHILQFFPTYSLGGIERTPLKTMEKAYEVAKSEGLKYVYLGNVQNHRLENTYCHNCGILLIERTILGVKRMLLKRDLRCPNCGETIPIKGKKWIPEGLWQKY